MQMGYALFVQLQLVFMPVDGEFAVTDAVGIAARGGAEIGGIFVVLEFIEAQNERRLVTIEAQILNDCAQVMTLAVNPPFEMVTRSTFSPVAVKPKFSRAAPSLIASFSRLP